MCLIQIIQWLIYGIRVYVILILVVWCIYLVWIGYAIGVPDDIQDNLDETDIDIFQESGMPSDYIDDSV